MTIIGEAFIAISPEGVGFARKLESQLKAAGLGNAGLALGLGIAGGIAFGLGAIGEEFDKVRKRIQQETGATGAELAGLADVVTESFRGVPTSLGNAAVAVDELFRRGIPLGPQIGELAKQELFLAKITRSDLGAAVQTTTGLMQKFNVPIGDQGRELDVLFKGYQKSGQGLDTLTAALQTGGGVLQQFGFDLDESIALLSGLERAGVNLGPALAGLRLAFGKVAAAGGDPKKVLQDLLDEFTDGTPRAKAMADAIQLFGKRSGAELSIALSKGKFDIHEMLKEITDGKDGIVETGLATLTLGDQFKLLRNNIEAALSGAGTNVLHAFERGVESAAEPVGHLAEATGHLLVVLAPIGKLLLPVLAPLKLALPVVDAFATGLDVIADELETIPAPLLAGAAALGIITLASLGAADGLIALGIAGLQAGADFAVAFPEITIAAAAVVALGAAVNFFADDASKAPEIAKELGKSLFDTSNEAGIFKTGITSATDALRVFIDEQIRAGKADSLKGALTISGSDSTQAAQALSGPTQAWKQYRDAAVAAAADSARASGLTVFQVSLFASRTRKALAEQRQAFILTAQTELEAAVATGQITRAEELHILALNRSKGGAIEYGGALDALNREIAANETEHNKAIVALQSTSDAEADLARELAAGTITEKEATTALQGLGLMGAEVQEQLDLLKAKAAELNQVHDASVSKTVASSTAYGVLARQIALGNVQELVAETRLRAMGFSAEGAKAAFSELQSSIDEFVSAAVGKIPDAGAAVEAFNDAVKGDVDQLKSDVDERERLQESLAKSLANGAQSLRGKLAAINIKIGVDQNAIATGTVKTTSTLDSDLRRRTVILQTAAQKGGEASASLTADIRKNNAAIHDDFAKLVADNDPAKFTEQLFRNAVNTASFLANLRTLTLEGLGVLAGELAKQGPETAGGLAAALASDPAKAKVASAAVELAAETTDRYRLFLEQHFPQLTGTGETAGERIGRGIADGIVRELLKIFPQLADVGVGIGENFGSNVATSAARTSGRDLRRFGADGGLAFSQGLAKGLIDNEPTILEQIERIGRDVKTRLGDVWVARSPSQVAVELGSNFAEGLAVGLESLAGRVTSAAGGLAAAITTQTTKGLDASTSEIDDRLGGVDERLRDKFGKAQFPDRLEPPHTPIVPVALPVPPGSLQIAGQTGLERQNARDEFERIARAQPPLVVNVTQTDPEPLHIAAELAWELSR